MRSKGRVILLALLAVCLVKGATLAIGEETASFGIYPEVAVVMVGAPEVTIGPYLEAGSIALDATFGTTFAVVKAHTTLTMAQVLVGLLIPYHPSGPPYVDPFIGLAYSWADKVLVSLSASAGGAWWLELDYIVKTW